MAKYIGRLVNLGVAPEASRGAGAAPVYHLPKNDFSFDDKIVKARSEASLGKISDSEEAFVTTNYGQGDFGGEIRSKSFGLLLYAMLGSKSVSGPTDEAYTHSFTLSHSNQHPSLSFVVADANTTELYKLVMLDSLEITAELDQVVQYTTSFMSKKGNATGLTVPSAVVEDKFTKKHVAVRVATDVSGLAAATALSIKSLTLSISKNVTLDDVLGTAEPEDILNRQISVEGQIMLNYEDETWKNYFRNGTYRSMEIKMVNTDETLGGGSTNPSLTIQMPKVDFHEWSPEYGLNDISTQTISFKANYDLTNGADIISLCQLVNDVASY